MAIRVDKIEDSTSCNVYYDNGVLIGEFCIADDGDYVFFPEKRNGGYWSGHLLRDISNWLMMANEKNV